MITSKPVKVNYLAEEENIFQVVQAHISKEDITVHLLTLEEVRSLLDKNEIMQALNAAPLWKYIANL